MSRWLVAVVALLGVGACADGAAPFVEAEPAKQWTGMIEAPKDRIKGFTLSPDGHTLFTTGDGTFSLWDLRTGKVVRGRARVSEEPYPSSRAFVSEGRQIACTELGNLYTLDLLTLKFRLTHKQDEPDWVGDLVASASGATLASQRGRKLAVWDLAKSKLLWHKAVDEARLSLGGMAVSPDGKVLAVGFNHDSQAEKQEVARLYDAKTGRELRRLSCEVYGPGRHLVYTQDGRWLVMAFRWGHKLHVWDALKGEVSRVVSWEPKGKRYSAYGVGLSPDGKTLFVQGTGEVRLYETATWGLRGVIDETFDDFRLCFGDRFVGLSGGRVHVGRWRDPAKVGPRTKDDLARLWKALGSEDAGTAFEASKELLAAPEQAVALLSRLPRVAPVSFDAAKAVADLDNDDFDVRERASQKLAKAGPAAEVFLRAAWAAGPGPEARRRIAPLLKPLDKIGPERLRSLRGVEILEVLGTSAARKQLERLAAGADGSVEAQDARAALARARKAAK
jgi:hypothetical protein